MISFMFYDLKQAMKRKYTGIYVLCIFAMCLLANIAIIAFRAIYGAHEGTFAYNVMEYATWCFILPYYSCICIADIIFGNEYPTRRNKKVADSGLKPWQIYVSKFITSLALAFIFAVVTAMVLIVFTTIFHYRDGVITPASLKDFVGKFVCALPLWLAGISFANMFLFAFRSKKKAYIMFFVLTFAIPRLLMVPAAEPFCVPAFKFIRNYLITQNFSLLPYPADPDRSIPRTIAVGFVYTVISLAIGLLVYCRKERREADSAE